MVSLLNQLPPWLALLVLGPPALAVASWALRLACSFSLIDPPDFWHGTFSVIVLLIANILLRFFVTVTNTPPSLAVEYLAPVLTSAAVIALTVPVNPISALMISVLHILLCVVAYIGLSTFLQMFLTQPLY